jgi:hypothetical protein
MEIERSAARVSAKRGWQRRIHSVPIPICVSYRSNGARAEELIPALAVNLSMVLLIAFFIAECGHETGEQLLGFHFGEPRLGVCR